MLYMFRGCNMRLTTQFEEKMDKLVVLLVAR